mgnify:CR=1 FL=1
MDDRYRAWTTERDRAVWGPYGIASLAATHWLDEMERSVEMFGREVMPALRAAAFTSPA